MSQRFAVVLLRDFGTRESGREAERTNVKGAPVKEVPNPTVGEFLAEVREKAGLRPKTLRHYETCFRKIVADVFCIGGGVDKYDYRQGGQQKWREKVEAVELDAITPEKVQAWKGAFLAKKGQDPLSQAKARRSVNSLIRCSKALFARSVTQFVNIHLPKPLPFEGIQFEKEGSKRYKSIIDYRELAAAAKNELAKTSPEQYTIFLLALGAGLRKGEIDTLCWEQINWDE